MASESEAKMAYHEANCNVLLAGPGAANSESEYRYAASLAGICEALHMSCWGAADPMSDEEASACYHWLVWRLEHWHQSSPCRAYDDAVRALVVAAVDEVGMVQSIYDNHAVVLTKPWGK